MSKVQCFRCGAVEKQVRAGRTAAGSQRYRCKLCGSRYTPQPKLPGYDDEVRLQAVTLFQEGYSLRTVGRILQVNHQTVANWVQAAEDLADLDLPTSVSELAEWDGYLD